MKRALISTIYENTRSFNKKIYIDEAEMVELKDTIRKLEKRLRHAEDDTEFFRKKYKEKCAETKVLKKELEDRKLLDMNSKAGVFEKLFQQEREYSLNVNMKLIDSLKESSLKN